VVCDAGKLRTETDPVTLGVPEIEIDPTHTVVPLTAVAIFEIALLPKLTTLWATICSPPVTTEERVVAD
jgi:hypothetical protein